MKLKQFLPGIALTSGLLLSTAASAAVINLGAAADTSIYADGNVNGTGQGMFVGSNGQGTIQRSLIDFDLSGIGAGSTINSVTLTIHVNAQGYLGSPETITLNALNEAWNEASVGSGGPSSGGGGGNAPAPGDATWTDSGNGAWTAGGNFDATISASASVAGGGTTAVWSGAGLIADVQDWVDNGGNFGWILRGNETAAGSAKRFSSSENALHPTPVLSIDYTAAVVPVPAAVWLFGSGLLGLVGIARRKTRI